MYHVHLVMYTREIKIKKKLIIFLELNVQKCFNFSHFSNLSMVTKCIVMWNIDVSDLETGSKHEQNYIE